VYDKSRRLFPYPIFHLVFKTIQNKNMNAIYISPKGIIDYLKKIECVIPMKEFRQYKPTQICSNQEITDKHLTSELYRMLDFVGLKGYEVEVGFSETDEGVAGTISSLSPYAYDRKVHIDVSKKFTLNWKSCVAVLAHELSHKVLYVNGIYEQDVQKNEIMTDISTLYLGFGDVVLDGYVSGSNMQILGYLTYDNYKVAYMIINIIYGKDKSTDIRFGDVDVLVDEALKVWRNSESEIGLMKECFKEQERQLSELYRNLTMLEQIVKQCKQDMISIYERFEDKFYKSLKYENGELKNKITAFSRIYELIINDSYPVAKDNQYYNEMNGIVEEALFNINKNYQAKQSFEFKYYIECPCCRNSKLIKSSDEKNRIMLCTRCGCHFLFYSEKLNFTKVHHKIKMRKENMINSIKEEFEKKFEKKMEIAETRVKNAEAEKYEAIMRVKMFEKENYRETVMKKVPLYLKWLIGKYLR
jgi:hypothetical protein